MPSLNTEQIKKLKKGELGGVIATAVASVACVAFAVLLIIAIVRNDAALRLYAFVPCLPVMAAAALIAALCNLKYGRAIDRLINNYVQEVFIENATQMHPERDSLTYYISYDNTEFVVKVNSFKDGIIFDFSAFGKLTATRKSSIFTAIAERLGATFCRLYERGGNYKSVTYRLIKNGKQGKLVNIIENGVPDKRAYKNYLKNSQK